jgi:hypothetical protein
VGTETALMQSILRITDGLKMSMIASVEVIFLGLQFLEFVQAKLSRCNGIFKVVHLEMSCEFVAIDIVLQQEEFLTARCVHS